MGKALDPWIPIVPSMSPVSILCLCIAPWKRSIVGLAQGFETLAGKEEDLQNGPEILLPVLIDQHRVEVDCGMPLISEDVYPFIFEDGPAMLMPHLPYLKKFSQLAIHVSLLESYRQDANDLLKVLFSSLMRMSDLLISQLVAAVFQKLSAFWLLKTNTFGLIATGNGLTNIYRDYNFKASQ